MWLIITYEPSSLFSLKSTNSTSSGGKTNIIPTMYSVKLALINALYRMNKNGEKEFNWLKKVKIRFSPPQNAIVNNSFIKILREPKVKKDYEFISSIAYREFVFYSGELQIAFDVSNLEEYQKELLIKASAHVNYFGKKGSFVQFKGYKLINEAELSKDFSWVIGDERVSFNSEVIFQQLDDISDKTDFSKINTYDEEKNKIGKDRLLISVAIPYKIKSSSRGYTHYFKLTK